MGKAHWIVGLLAALAHAGESKTVAKGEAGQSIVQWIERAEKAGFTGAVLAARDGQVIAAVGAGFAQGRTRNTPATLFEIASLTKQFTAAAALRLVDEGKLKLDAPMADYLPGIPEDCKAITTRHLLQHTSGIPRSNARGAGTDLAAVLPSFLEGGPRHEPGKHWGYWNQGYALVSEIIARAAGEPYTEYCRKALFQPAKLKTTLFTGDAAPEGVTVAIGQSARGRPRSALAHPYGEYGFQYRGMGGVVSSVWDLWRWDRALRGKLLREESKKQLFQPGLQDYALGWYVLDKNGRRVHSHGGSVRGFVCQMRRYPDQDACVIVLCNRDDLQPWMYADAVEQMLFGEPLTVKLPTQADDATAKRLVGKYAHGRLGHRLRVWREAGKLRAILNWKQGWVGNLVIGPDEAGTLVAFQGGKAYPVKLGEAEDGQVKSITIHRVQFDRVP
ncbi:MAG: serine hydrolase domain-containing protein [Planctomycetota bacterium]